MHNHLAAGDLPLHGWAADMDPKNQANLLTFEAACLATYLTFFNMAGDNIKTKMSAQPDVYRARSLVAACYAAAAVYVLSTGTQ